MHRPQRNETLTMRYKYLLIVVLFGCSNSEKSSDTQTDSLNSEGVYSALTLDEYDVFYNSDSNAVKASGVIDLTIDFDCAVLIYPTSEEINQMKED